MDKFENYFKLEFKEDYIKYVSDIQNNIIRAYYDISFLEALNPYAKRHKKLESFSYKLVTQIVRVFWSDLILCITKLLEIKPYSLSINKLNGIINDNYIESKKVILQN